MEITTTGMTFRDGALIDLLQEPFHPDKLLLVRWKEGGITIGPTIEHAGRIFAPAPSGATIPGLMQLPTRVAPEESPRDLFSAIVDLLKDVLRQPKFVTSMLAILIFASWVSDALPMAPCFWILPMPAAPKSAAQRLLNRLCRRSMLLVALRRGDLAFLPWDWNPTLLLDEPDPQSAMRRVLRHSSRRGECMIVGRRLLDPYGIRVVLSRELPFEMLPEADVLRISLMSVAGPNRFLNEATEERIAEEFQGRLQGFRLRNFAKVQMTRPQLQNLTPPLQDLGRALCAAVAGDDELMSLVLELLNSQEQQIRADATSATESVVIEALLSFCHQVDTREVRCLVISRRTEAIYAGRGSKREISPEQVGWKLKHLGIPVGRIGSAGKGVNLTNAVRQQVHELAILHGVLTVASGPVPPCPFCQEFKERLAVAT